MSIKEKIVLSFEEKWGAFLSLVISLSVLPNNFIVSWVKSSR